MFKSSEFKSKELEADATTQPMSDTGSLERHARFSRHQRDSKRTRFLRQCGWDIYLGALIIGVCLVAALFGPNLAPHDPAMLHPRDRLAPPSLTYPLGTDNLGRDIASRMLHGARLSLGIASLTALLIMMIGVSVGLVSGYLGGLVDDIIMRVVDTLLAFPSLIISLAIIGMLGPGMVHAVIGLLSVWWVSYARVVRGLVLSLKTQPYIESVRALGASDARIVIKHILPQIIPAVLVLLSLEIGQLILALAGLGFLGLGAQPPTAEWGAMINDGRRFLQSAPQLMIIPGVVIGGCVLGFNLLGDGLRDVLDTKST
ncbi:MAG: nickel transporter permease [Deinococcota bacterium]